MKAALFPALLGLVFVAMLVTAFFGSSFMTMEDHSMAGCFGTVPGGTCAMLAPWEHFVAHMNIFQRLSSAVPGGSFILLLAFAAILLTGWMSVSARTPRTLDKIYLARAPDTKAIFRAHFGHWLALREKRDPSFSGALN